jgi:hypothetical protein
MKLFDLSPTQTEVVFPNPRHTVMDVQEPFVRDQEIDPGKYYPADVYREPVPVWPPDFKIDVATMIPQKIAQRAEAKLDDLIEKLQGLRAEITDKRQGQ